MSAGMFPSPDCGCCGSDVALGHKCVNGLAWWPGFLAFTLNGSTLNTTRHQTATNTPFVSRKFRTYTYHSEATNSYTNPSLGLQTYEATYDVTFVFDADYGDLVSATASRTYLANGSPSGAYPDYDYSWDRSDGLFAASSVASVVTPSTASWPFSSSGIRVNNLSVFDTTYQAGLPANGVVTLDDNDLTFSETTTYDPGPALGTDGNYEVTTRITLSDESTFADRADEAVALANGLTLGTADASLTTLYPISLTSWRDPGSYSQAATFAFTETAADIVAAGSAEDASNNMIRCHNRYASEIITVMLGVTLPEGIITAYGLPNGAFDGGYTSGLFTMSGATNFWDEPQVDVAVRAARSIVNLDTGLFCGNTATYYYDFEGIVPNDNNTAGPMAVGVHGLSAQVRSFTITELQSQLAALSATYGAGWLGSSPMTRPSCP